MDNTNYQNAPGKGLLKVSGIILIIFAAISIVILLAGLAVSSAVADYLGSAATAVAVGALIIGLISSAFSLVMGILGVKFSNRPDKAMVCIVFAVIAIVLQITNLVMDGTVYMAIIGLVLPVLYLIGALQNKKAA